MSDAPPRSDVRFTSGADRCHAWLYLPTPTPAPDAGAPPVVVMAHGLGGVKALRLAAFAERFQAAGYACLVFDYRHFGDSEGQPRELLSIRRQREDWHAAVAFARSLPEVDGDRVVVWGTSFAGGHAITTAAEDADVVAAIAQCPFTDGFASARTISPLATVRVGFAAFADHLARLLRRPPVRVKVAGRPGEVALMNAPDALDGIHELLKASDLTEDEYPDEVPARVALEIPLHRPGRAASRVRCPILFSVCDGDTVAPPRATLRHAAKAPRGEVIRYPAGHFDIYTGEPFEAVVADQLRFLTTHVPPRTAP
ncbi:alpha/beta hydrolase [Actinokineospora bangkokensis]|uniref:Alpha/beta hydrolase n=1 Tax=Actinokineospora bangkokensis TaxID=1193682 RepID=A0A1Q9LML6_9PSEU|nr:alpha/beta hydrolase [Actinokineospora bangkokensis]OLR93255.1 alpha/beta hydrolase [Actinokineospora bangkokensis]